MNWIMLFSFKRVGGGASCGWFVTSNMSSLSRVLHVHGRNHYGIVVNRCVFLHLPIVAS